MKKRKLSPLETFDKFNRITLKDLDKLEISYTSKVRKAIKEETDLGQQYFQVEAYMILLLKKKLPEIEDTKIKNNRNIDKYVDEFRDRI